MAGIKLIEVSFDQDGKSPVILTHPMGLYGVANPGQTDVRLKFCVGFLSKESMFEVLDEAMDVKVHFVRKGSFVPVDSLLHIERLQLVAERSPEDAPLPDHVSVILTYPT